MLKRYIPVVFVLPALILALQGCVTDAMQGVSTFNNARSGYQAYQGMKGMKSYENVKPVLKDSDTLFVVVDLKSIKDGEDAAMQNHKAAAQICAAFDQQFQDMKAHNLNRGRELHCMSEGDVPSNAVVMNLREQVEEAGLVRLLQSDTIKSETSWVSRATGAIIDTQANPGFKKAEELVEQVGRSTSIQILRSLAPEQNDPEYKDWSQKAVEWSKERRAS